MKTHSIVQELRELYPGLLIQDFKNATYKICGTKTINRNTYYSSLWLFDDIVEKTLPLFFLQLAVLLFSNNVIAYIFNHLCLPEISAKILAGVLLGPSELLGSSLGIRFRHLFPLDGLPVIETFANLGLVYYMFMVGLETDMKPIRRAGKKALVLSLVSFAAAAAAGYGLYFLLLSDLGSNKELPRFGTISNSKKALFWSVALSCSQFPDIAKILTDLKLLNTKNGQLALVIAVMNDFFSWIFLVLVLAVVQNDSVKVITSTVLFTLLCFFVLRPLLKWLHNHTKDYHSDMEHTIVPFLLFGVLSFGLSADVLGAHSITGSYLLGISIPKGIIKEVLIEKVDGFVSTFFIPFFFLLSGLRFNVTSLTNNSIHLTTVVVVILLAFLSKFVVTVLVSLICKMSPKEGVSLGLLMNTKGILTLIALGSALEIQVLSSQAYSAMLLACWIMTLPSGLVLRMIMKYSRNSHQFKIKSIESSNPQNPLRIMASIFIRRDGNKLAELLEAFNATKNSPMMVFAAHLSELSKRPTTMLILDQDDSNSGCKSKNNNEAIPDILKHIDSNDVFSSLTRLRNEAIEFEKLTIMSDFSMVHEDISFQAEERNAKLLLVNFHKRARREVHSAAALALDDAEHDKTRVVLRHLLKNPPCSVGIFADRDLTKYKRRPNQSRHVAVFFIGGPDDREALAYAKRFIGNPNVCLTVVRFVYAESESMRSLTDIHDDDVYGKERVARFMNITEKMIDDDVIRQFRFHHGGNKLVNFVEKTVTCIEQALELIRKMEEDAYDLYIVDRNEYGYPLLSVLGEIMEDPELGPLGDTLVSSTYVAETSILILQQHGPRKQASEDDMLMTIIQAGGGLGNREQKGGRPVCRVPKKTTSDYQPFIIEEAFSQPNHSIDQRIHLIS